MVLIDSIFYHLILVLLTRTHIQKAILLITYKVWMFDVFLRLLLHVLKIEMVFLNVFGIKRTLFLENICWLVLFFLIFLKMLLIVLSAILTLSIFLW